MPSAKNASSLSLLRLSNGNTAMPAVGLGTNSLFQTFQPMAPPKAPSDNINRVKVGFRRTNWLVFEPPVKVFSQGEGGRITTLRIFLQTLEADGCQVAICFWIPETGL